MNIGEKIKELRKQKQLTQEQLAEFLSVSSQAISKWETGLSYPEINLLPQLALFFHISVDELLDYNTKKIEKDIRHIIDSSIPFRDRQPAKCEQIYREGLKKYPNNEILLNCLLMVIPTERSKEKIEIGEKLLALTTDAEIKYDVLRLMAQMYHALGENAMSEHYLNKLPELYFLKNSIAAQCYHDEKQLQQIEKAEQVSIGILLEMLELRKNRVSNPEEQQSYQDIGITLLKLYQGLCYSKASSKHLIQEFTNKNCLDCNCLEPLNSYESQAGIVKTSIPYPIKIASSDGACSVHHFGTLETASVSSYS